MSAKVRGANERLRPQWRAVRRVIVKRDGSRAVLRRGLPGRSTCNNQHLISIQVDMSDELRPANARSSSSSRTHRRERHAPTRAEIAEALGFRSATRRGAPAACSARACSRDRGQRARHRAEGRAAEQFGLPLSAAWPPAADPRRGAMRPLPDRTALFTPRPHYLLRVSGMSMRDVGSWMATSSPCTVARRPQPADHRRAARERSAVKRYRQEGSSCGSWRKTRVEPIRVDLRKQSMTIEGVVVGVLRRGRTDVMQ